MNDDDQEIAYIIGDAPADDLIIEQCCDCGRYVGYESRLREDVVTFHGEDVEIRPLCIECASHHPPEGIAHLTGWQVREMHARGLSADSIALIAAATAIGGPTTAMVLREIAAVIGLRPVVEDMHSARAELIKRQAANLLPTIHAILSSN